MESGFLEPPRKIILEKLGVRGIGCKITEKQIQGNLDLTKCQGTGEISRVRYIENLDVTNLWENNQSVRYIGV